MRREDGEYAATGTGELALETCRDARNRFRALDRFEPFFSGFDGASGLEFEWFEGARLETATEENPHSPIEWCGDRLEDDDGRRCPRLPHGRAGTVARCETGFVR